MYNYHNDYMYRISREM